MALTPPPRPFLIMTPPNAFPDIVPIVVIAPVPPALRSPPLPKSSENTLSMPYALVGFCLFLALIYVII
jgi:hypothetical protein